MNTYIVTTTGTNVYLKDLGLGAPLVHPTTVDLITYGFTLEELNRSSDLQSALSGGFLTATQNGVTVTPGEDTKQDKLVSGSNIKTINGSSVLGSGDLVVSGTGLADPGSNGVVVRTASNVTTARTITGTAGNISVTDGNGVAGNPTLDLVTTGTPGTYHRVTTDTFGRVTAGFTNTKDSTSTAITLNLTDKEVLSTSIPGGTLGTAGQLRITLLGSLLNNSGANRNYTIRIKYGGNTYFGDITGNVATGTVARPFILTATLVATGATNSSAVFGQLFIGAALAGSVAGTGDIAAVGYVSAAVSGTGTTDSTAAQNFEVSILSNSANATQTFTRTAFSVEVL